MSLEQDKNFHWVLKDFDDLSPREVYAIMKLRMEIFIVEQQSICLDMDNKDLLCAHLMLE